MGLRGPAPKPTALRVLEGNPSRRPLNAREPKPRAGEPEMPRHLDREARREWKRLVPILLGMRVLTEGDGIALANLCSSYSLLIQAQNLMLKAAREGKSGLLIKTPNGFPVQSPVLAVINAQMEKVGRLLREFGLTPAARSRITAAVDESDSVDALERKLCGDL